MSGVLSVPAGERDERETNPPGFETGMLGTNRKETGKMKDEDAKKLLSIVEAFKTKTDAAAAKKAEKKSKEGAFLEAFRKTIAETIRPAFEEIVAILKANGHDATIVQAQESRATDGRSEKHESLRLTVIPQGYVKVHDHDSLPEVAFTGDGSNERIRVYVSERMPGESGGSGPRGDHALDQITPEFVVQLTLEVLAKTLGR
jgi:hypothetical protein